MKYLGYAFAAMVGLVVGCTIKRHLPVRLTKKTVKVRIDNRNGQWGKTIYDRIPEVVCRQPIEWVIETDTEAQVVIDDFRDSETQTSKNPFVGNLSGRVKPPSGSLATVTRGPEMFDEPPAGKKDAFGRYQDFTYHFEIDGQRVDPDIRVREY